MKTTRLVVFVCAFVLQFTLAAYSQGLTSIDELRQQVKRLTAIANDPATDPDVRKINGGFLEERRRQLSALLRERLTTLQDYQTKISDVLTNAEKQVITQSAHDLQNEITALENTNATGPTVGPPLASQPVNFVSASPATSFSRSDAPVASSETGSSGASNPEITKTSAAGVPQVSSANAPPEDFNNWLDNRIRERIKAVAQARIDQRSNVNQTEAPAITDNSTSLVDQSSASDLIGVALNLSGLTGGSNTSDKDKNSAAVTATAYSLYSALRGQEALDPGFYNKHRDWRRLSFTLGFEKGQTNAQGQQTEDATIAGAKYLIVAGRDAARHQRDLGTVYEYLTTAAVNFAQLNKEIRNALLFGDPSLRDKLRIVEEVKAFVQQQLTSGSLNATRTKDFQDLLAEPVEAWFDPEKKDFAHLAVQTFIQNKYFGPAGFPLLKKALDEDALKQIDQFVDARLDAFTNLNNASRKAIEKIRRAPQFSLSFQSKLRKQEPDEYRGEAIFDYGVHDRVNLTLNGGYLYKNSRIIGGDVRAATFAGQLQFQMTPEKSFVGRSPLYFYLASEGKWASGTNSIFKLQGKVKIPLAEGIDFPISLTYANRTELIKEKDVRGQFGFSIDTAKLFRAFLSK